MNKKILSAIAAFSLSASLSFAELYPSSRFFEFGLDVNLTANQNLVTLDQILQEKLVIDFAKINKEMGSDGLVLNVAAEPVFYTNLNLGGWGAGVSIDVDNQFRLSIGKDLFEFLGEGNADSDTFFSTTVGVNLQSFVKVAAPVKFRFGRLRFKVAPTVFVPVAYVPAGSKVNASITCTEDGVYTALAEGTVDLYTLFPIGSLTGGEFDFNTLLQDATSDIWGTFMNSAGMNLNVGVEFPLFRTLDVGAYGVIPVIPGRLNYVSSAYANYRVDNISVSSVMNNEVTFATPEMGTHYGFEDCHETVSGYVVNPPFRLGVEGAWRPFGKWCTFRPMFGVACDNPFGSDTNESWENFKENFYFEYGLGTDVTLLYIFNFWLHSQYVEQIFSNTFGFGINFRVLEVDVTVASSSASFAKSWCISGADATISLKMGL